MYDFVVDGLGKNVIVEENEGELEMKKYELSAFVNFDNYLGYQFPVGGGVGALNRVVADYSFSDYRLQGLWFFDEEHCFKDACN